VDGLIRVVRLGGGSLALGRALPGRGAWLCQDSPGCIDQALKRHAFSRALRDEVGSPQVDQLRLALRSALGGKEGPGSEGQAL
jgi:predicted RNA-binding protein YlxR (DUF448 family)